MRTFVVEEALSEYRWSEENKCLEYRGIANGGDDEFVPVDEEYVGDEMLVYKGERITFSQLYRYIEKQLK